MKDWIYAAAAVFAILTVSSYLDGHAFTHNTPYIESNAGKTK